MQIPPFGTHHKSRSPEHPNPLADWPHGFADGDLTGTTVQTQPATEKSGVGHEYQESCAKLGNPPHFLQRARLIQEVLERTHAGDDVEPFVVKRQLFCHAFANVSIMKPLSGTFDRACRYVHAADLGTMTLELGKPIAGPAGDVQHHISLRQTKSFCNHAHVPRNRRRTRFAGVVHVVVEALNLLMIRHACVFPNPRLRIPRSL